MSMQMPDFLESMLNRQYGEELTRRICEGSRGRRPVTLRVNTLKADVQQVRESLASAGIGYRSVSWSEEALILEGVREPVIRELPLYQNGEIYLQSLSSMIPPILLDPQEECILDMAAAPGGKTTQMAALSNGRAQITACEKNPARAERLRYNLEKQGASKVLVMREDARKLDPFFSFDKILLDAPCSGSGTLHLGEETMREERQAEIETKRKQRSHRQKNAFTEELIIRSSRTQEALLRKALELLKPGGEMIYSTCSILEVENERVLQKILPQAGAKIVPITHLMLQDIPLLPVKLPGTCCVCPTELYEGFFVAKIQKI